MEKQKVIFARENVGEAIDGEARRMQPDRVFVLCDETTRELCLPVVESCESLKRASVAVISPGDEHKDLESLSSVWRQLGEGGATRHSLLICLGGGMVTDLGGFAASTFKRGISLINVPTTLLSMVDASVGGKTGINFMGLKNEVGVFRNADAVVLAPDFLKTLDRENLLSGYAEMLKHGLISDDGTWARLLRFPWEETRLPLTQEDGMRLFEMVVESVGVKERVVEEDPLEKGLRKALNLGHTFGHAFESLALRRKPVLHGYAVAWGLACELLLSCMKTGFPKDKMRQTAAFIKSHYGQAPVSCDDYDELLRLMQHDKKNIGTSINFSLLSDVGCLMLNQTAAKEEIIETLDLYREAL